METIEDYIVNKLFEYRYSVEDYSYNDVLFESGAYKGESSLITIHFNNPINEKLLKSVQNYTRDIFKVEHEGFQEYNPYHDPNTTDVACDYDNFDDPSILICLSDGIKRYINKRISKFGYKVEYSVIMLNNDDFMEYLEDILDEIVHFTGEDYVFKYRFLSGEEYALSFKSSVCDKFSGYIWRKTNF